MRGRVFRFIDHTGVGHRAICDRRFRAALFTGVGLVWNFIYGIYNGILGAAYGSKWFAVLCVYYLTLCAMRFLAMQVKKRKKMAHDPKTVMLRDGIALLFLAFILSATVFVSISDSIRRTYPKTAMIGIAAYTFYMAVLAIVNTVRAHREQSDFLMTVRNISLAAATASMMSLERSMIATFSPEDTVFAFTMDVCTGVGGFLIVAALGVSMIFSAKRPPLKNADAF